MTILITKTVKLIAVAQKAVLLALDRLQSLIQGKFCSQISYICPNDLEMASASKRTNGKAKEQSLGGMVRY